MNIAQLTQLNRQINERVLLANIERNGKQYPEVMGKFKINMMFIPSHAWLRCLEILGQPMTDESAAKMDRIMEDLRCVKCGQIGSGCTC